MSDQRHRELAEQLLSVRPTTRNLVTSILMDAWPSHAAIVDFVLVQPELEIRPVRVSD